MVKKGKQDIASVMPEDDLIRSFTYQYDNDWATISNTPSLPRRGHTRDDMLEKFLTDVENTLHAKYHLDETVAFLYAQTNLPRIGSEISSDSLYSAWVYWMLEYGTPEQVHIARMCAWMDTQNEEILTKKSLLQAVRYTVIEPRHRIDTLELGDDIDLNGRAYGL